MGGRNKSMTCRCFCTSRISIRKLSRFEDRRLRQMYKEILDKLWTSGDADWTWYLSGVSVLVVLDAQSMKTIRISCGEEFVLKIAKCFEIQKHLNRLRLTPNSSFCCSCPQTFFLLWRGRDLRWEAYGEMRVARHYLTYDQCTESCNVIAFSNKSFLLDAFCDSQVANIQSSRRSSHVIDPHLCRRLFAMQLCEQLRWAVRCFLHDVNSSP